MAQIEKIKKYVFVDTHFFAGGEVKRFDSSYEMAESWQRLIEGKKILPHDLTLLKHELMECDLVQQGHTQEEAHVLTSAIYNYAKEAHDYYDKIGAYQKKE